jgi:hypothetical protein
MKRGLEVAPPRIIDQAILQSILDIAPRINTIRQQLEFGYGNRGGIEGAGHSDRLKPYASHIEHRRAGNNAVEIPREPLRRHQSLAASGGAAIEI